MLEPVAALRAGLDAHEAPPPLYFPRGPSDGVNKYYKEAPFFLRGHFFDACVAKSPRLLVRCWCVDSRCPEQCGSNAATCTRGRSAFDSENPDLLAQFLLERPSAIPPQFFGTACLPSSSPRPAAQYVPPPPRGRPSAPGLHVRSAHGPLTRAPRSLVLTITYARIYRRRH